MSAVTSDAVTILDSWTVGGMADKKRKKVKATISLTAQGGSGNEIAATLLGMDVVEEATPFVYDTDQVGLLVPDATGANLNVAIIDTGALTLGDITEDITVVVTGYNTGA